MRIALDPHMHRHLSLEALPHKVTELGFDWMELAPRGDFLEWFKAPRVFPERVRAFKRALNDADVKIASLLPMNRWASNDEVERLAAVRHWKRAIEICVELGVDTMNSEFGRGPHPDKGSCYCCVTDVANRSWNYVAVSAGRDLHWWKEFFSVVRMTGYDGWVSLEMEDFTMSTEAGIRSSIDALQATISR